MDEDIAIVAIFNNSLFNFLFPVTVLVKLVFFLTMKFRILVSSIFSLEKIL